MLNCSTCGKTCKSKGGLSAHQRLAHPAPSEQKVSKGEEKVLFVSPRAPELGIVLKGREWEMVTTPTGGKLLLDPLKQAKRIDFEMGKLITSDPEVIHYLTNVYNDKRFPIISKGIYAKGA